MTNDFIQDVRNTMLPALVPITLRIDDFRETPASFGNALVDLHGGSLRVRVLRERGQILAAFGSVKDPTALFDSAFVMALLGLTETGGFDDSDSTRALTGIASFIRVHFYELNALFGPAQYAETKQKLRALRDEQMEKLWGNTEGWR
jgi:hypothetical protein